jgi:hypothetical protein
VFVECDGQHNYSCLAPSSTRNQRRKGKWNKKTQLSFAIDPDKDKNRNRKTTQIP